LSAHDAAHFFSLDAAQLSALCTTVRAAEQFAVDATEHAANESA
jgi:hypothetical protein